MLADVSHVNPSVLLGCNVVVEAGIFTTVIGQLEMGTDRDPPFRIDLGGYFEGAGNPESIVPLQRVGFGGKRILKDEREFPRCRCSCGHWYSRCGTARRSR